MKRPIFFIVSGVLVVVLLAAWVYVLFFSTPGTSNDDDLFADFPFGGSDTGVIAEPITTEEEPTIDLTSQEALRQLTLDPVVGFQEVRTSSTSNPALYYVTAGTGHVFTINLTSGEEKRISGTTIAQASHSAITPNGQYVLTQSGEGSGSEFFISPLNTGAGNAPIELIQEKIVDFKATTENTFLYSVKVGNGLEVREYVPGNTVVETLFVVPFQEASIVWGDNASSTHYVYPKTSTRLEGYLYEVGRDTEFRRLVPGGFGFSATANSRYVVFSNQNSSQYTSYVYNNNNNTVKLLPINAIPQKCSYGSEIMIICATNDTEFNGMTPDEWHSGEVSYADNFIAINLQTNETRFLLNSFEKSGRVIDVVNMSDGGQNTAAYFQNKNDKTLWLYDY
jgi:hypothetical protein